MKKASFLTLILGLGLAVSCGEKQNQQPADDYAQEESLSQPQRSYKGSDGTTLTLIYFAKGNEVAVKLEKQGVKQELKAAGINHEGNPIFIGETFSWEMLQDGRSGKLTSKDQKTTIYKEE